MGKVIYLMDYIEKNNDLYKKHYQLYRACYDHFISVPEPIIEQPSEAEIDAMEAEFMASYVNNEG